MCRRASFVRSPLLLLLLIIGITSSVCAGAATGQGASVLDATAAARRAVSLANADAKHRFGIAPFTTSRGTLRLLRGRWHWEAIAGYGKSDLLARVSFSKTGSDADAQVTLYEMILEHWW
jgi:hypothetical protein